LEPVVPGIEHLDPVYTQVAGVDSRTTGRLGCGAAVQVWGPLAAGLGFGMAASTTDFGLLDGPTARLARFDVTGEVRARPPSTLHGFGVQVAVGGGFLGLGYRPDRVELATEAGPITVDLEPVRRFTRHVAAEVLHSVPGGEIGLRTSWRFYSLEVATPAGPESRAVRDLQLGLVLRVAVF
jgi:hypothetical protein